MSNIEVMSRMSNIEVMTTRVNHSLDIYSFESKPSHVSKE